ncbi:TolB family protein [Inconstantimicrobium mannanitabidum]|uniref:Uncharacterized protein n=1 Tax=Inconstantimicrobium mannanitabidum TaxID=1604901 RepID=A0ACB5RCZ1_9CLOT|nr:DPP IV N-terminal domain-containing protein [Clostridium sp. TW13]GKX67140.1 hypothetical protein rsdtw13_23980 [Clostridium sp. TW13]
MKKINMFILTVILFFIPTNIFAKDNKLDSSLNEDEFVVYVAKDGLYISTLQENSITMLDKGNKIKNPLISKNGDKVAYIKNDDLYVCDIKKADIVKVDSSAMSYTWNNAGELVYSTEDKGMSLYNSNTKKSEKIINNEYYYYNINFNSKDLIYANKRPEYGAKSTSLQDMGIISYSLSNKEEKLLLSGVPTTIIAIGSTPNISRISRDDKYIYIWNKPNSASMSADVNEFAVYDVVNNKFIQFNSGEKNFDLDNNKNMNALAYKNNISPNPVDSNIIAIIKGGGREMFADKTLGILDIKTAKFTEVPFKDKVEMMPCYSEDGKKILFSVTKSLEYDMEKGNVPILRIWQNQPHYIYEVDAETLNKRQITSSKYFDFMPRYIKYDEILFVRAIGDSFSLWKTKNGIETKLADNLSFGVEDYTSSWYYGHYKTEKVIDLFIKDR